MKQNKNNFKSENGKSKESPKRESYIEKAIRLIYETSRQKEKQDNKD